MEIYQQKHRRFHASHRQSVGGNLHKDLSAHRIAHDVRTAMNINQALAHPSSQAHIKPFIRKSTGNLPPHSGGAVFKQAPPKHKSLKNIKMVCQKKAPFRVDVE